MKWYLKVLRHYADFSGRARRKEYWLFVLFYMIFAPVWMFIMAFAYLAISGGNRADETAPFAVLTANLIYAIAFWLPMLALTVRRMHDLGKSGWMIFVGAIPLIGGIWMLVLLCTEGQAADNRYGQNPKTSPETFSQNARLKSAGVALMVAAGAAMLSAIYHVTASLIVETFHYSGYYMAINVFILALSFVAGYLLSRNVKAALVMLLASVAVSFLLTV